ncbi:MAG: OsmC family protein [Bacteroidales bacterium]|jgi:ribosomal protein S12 methylthiotransferase accessory factor|nr:OsmC family protein [Bacteroidales bacterium]
MNMEIYFDGNKKVNARFNGQDIKTDQPMQGGGDGTAPAPFDLFLASIGTCAGIYVKGFCDQRGIPSENIKIIQKMNFNPLTRLIDKIDLEIQVPDDFPEKYKDAVINAANLCAVKRHMQEPPAFDVYTQTVHAATR